MRVNQSGNARHEIELPVAFVCLSPARCRQSLQGGLPPCPAAVQVRCPSNPSKSAVQVAVPSPLSKSRFQVRCARFRHPWVVAWHADCHTLACVPPEKKGRSLACRRSGQRAYINKPMVDIHALGVPPVGIRSRMRPVTIAATRAVAAHNRSSAKWSDFIGMSQYLCPRASRGSGTTASRGSGNTPTMHAWMVLARPNCFV